PSPGRETFRPWWRGLEQALRDRGYVDGQNIRVEWRAADQRVDRLRDLAGELVRLQVDVIVALGDDAIRATQHATTTIPIVMGGVNDPVAFGFVKSLAHPGGNITGVEFIPLSFCYDAPLTSQYSDRRHDPWQVYDSLSCSPVPWSSWISRA